MSLPSIVAPTYDVKLLSLPKPVKYRPYLVKEEKLLLIAKQGEDAKEIEDAVKQIVQACTFGAVNVDQLASFDFEYLFLQLRAKSVNNVVEIRFECKNPVGGDPEKVCHNIVPVSINLDDVKLTVPEGHSNRIMLTDTVGVTLRYPTIHGYSTTPGTVLDVVPLLTGCLDTIFTTNGEVHEIREENPTEVTAFVESLSLQQIEKLRTFFDTLPRLSHTFNFACSKCGYVEEITLSGLQDFFE